MPVHNHTDEARKSSIVVNNDTLNEKSEHFPKKNFTQEKKILSLKLIATISLISLVVLFLLLNFQASFDFFKFFKSTNTQFVTENLSAEVNNVEDKFEQLDNSQFKNDKSKHEAKVFADEQNMLVKINFLGKNYEISMANFGASMPPVGSVRAGSSSAEDRFLLLLQELDYGLDDIYVFDSTTEEVNFVGYGKSDQIVWSPSTQFVVFVRPLTNIGPDEIELFDVANMKLLKLKTKSLPNMILINKISWSPDGEKIIGQYQDLNFPSDQSEEKVESNLTKNFSLEIDDFEVF